MRTNYGVQNENLNVDSWVPQKRKGLTFSEFNRRRPIHEEKFKGIQKST